MKIRSKIRVTTRRKKKNTMQHVIRLVTLNSVQNKSKKHSYNLYIRMSCRAVLLRSITLHDIRIDELKKIIFILYEIKNFLIRNLSLPPFK